MRLWARAMTKSKIAKLPFQTSFFYGWVIVGISALILFFSGPGQTYSVSTFIDSYISEFGWSRSIVSSVYSIGTLIAGLFMGLLGNFFDKLGHRLMTTLIALLLGISCLWMSFISSIPMLFVGFFLIRLLGQGSLSLSSVTLIPQWFIKNKGQALSLVYFGGAVSSAILPPLNTWLIQTNGWRIGWRFWTALLCMIMVPLSYLLIRDRPEDFGLWPDKEKVSLKSFNNTVTKTISDDWSLKETLQTKTFWLLFFCLAVPSAIITGLVFHQVSMMAQLGLSAEVAAMVLSVMAMVKFPMLFIVGRLADRVKVRYLMAFSQGILLLGIAVLYFAINVQLALVYGVLIGVMMTVNSISSDMIWPEYYGRRNLSSIRGITMMAMVLGSALGPLPYGFAYDIFKSYQQVLLASMLFPSIGILAAMMATPPKKN